MAPLHWAGYCFGMNNMPRALRLLSASLLVVGAACDPAAKRRGDSLQTQLTESQQLSNQLSSQKDSLTRVVLDADAFLGQMDSAVKTVRGLPKSKRTSSESPLADQVAARKEMMERVNALVARAKATANQLAEAQKKEADLQTENAQMREAAAQQAQKISDDAQMIADLGSTIERQRVQIETLQMRLDSLSTEISTIGTRHFRAYYVIGTEKELLDKHIIVKEGGANLLIVRAGRTLQPARVLNAELFTAIDQREAKMIEVPDTTKRYRLVSRQDLDDAEVQGRDKNTFKGNLKITKPDEFWAASRFLILVKQ
jgi:predicted RNase H-like nuclease (RuvC/YqgF family)